MKSVPALTSRGPGHQFVFYADACSGIPGALHEQTAASVNQVVAALDPPPEFICFPGDEIIGLTADADKLRAQWRYWFEHEMSWLDRDQIPLYHTSGNHTTYDRMSEKIFQEMMAHLPQNGPAGQEGLTYFVRRGDLLMIFVHTLWSGDGGEGFVETSWLRQTLTEHNDARYKLIFGHHPIFPVNGFAGSYQREVGPESGRLFWDILVEHEVFAYVCSHILAFDVQVHQGVLQILTAGAGTAHRMPEEIEYLHCIQGALDEGGLRYQVLDSTGLVREWLQWPLEIPSSRSWTTFESLTPYAGRSQAPQSELVVLEFSGEMGPAGSGQEQTLLCGRDDLDALPSFWVGFKGADNRLAIRLSPQKGRSPHLWTGPALANDKRFRLQLALHNGMGPGGLLWRYNELDPWQSLSGASAWGLERLQWPQSWFANSGPGGHSDAPFRGQGLSIKMHRSFPTLE